MSRGPSPLARRALLAALALTLVLGGAAAPASAETGDDGTITEGTPDTSPVTVVIPKSTTPAVSPATVPAPAGSGSGSGGKTSATTSTPAGGTPAPTCSIAEDGAPVVPASPVTTQNTLITDRAAYSPGDTVHVSGGGFAASQPVRAMTFAGDVIVADPVADAAGAVSYDVTIPDAAATGELAVQLVGWNCGYVAAVTVLVGDATPAGFGGLPQWWWLLIVGGLAVIATVLIIVGRSNGWFARPGTLAPLA
ncbi:hypothetical protein ASF06_00755 [Agreia sp. Leaf244]|uniref:hypothetical protein n=1 Tax=Agreia sp. Leaf244 TaxID=1736305 RepID=UPI0006F9BAE3|nr:hypothetical protein [Agreia sp. Leaf244]KQO11237.1 hypothetical protein ASF06_00755 [Agreia sp. Leaf244]